MARLGYIHSSYGKEFNIAIANTWSSNVMGSTLLPPMTMVISSPYDVETGEDIGLHSILATDYEGNPARITYAMKPGNGLVVDGDIMKLGLDESLLANDGYLGLDVQNLVDNASIILDNGILKGDAESLQTSSKDDYGVIKVDGFTMKSNDGVINVETSALDLADNASSSMGLVSVSANSQISISAGIMSIDYDNLAKGPGVFGIVKADGSSIVSNDGELSASIDSFPICSQGVPGIAKEDNITVSCSQDGILSAVFGPLGNRLIKVDNSTIKVSNDGVMTIQDAPLTASLLDIGRKIDQINTRIDTLEESISDYSPVITGNAIFSFTCNGLASAMLVKPTEYGEMPKDMKSQQVAAEFTINTNCAFKVFIEYLDNYTPQVLLYEINYNDIDIYSGNSGLAQTFQSTGGKDAIIKLSWLCKNYANNDAKEYSKKTRINIDIVCADDASIKKSVKYSILRYNSLYTTEVDYSAHNEEVAVNKNKSTKGTIQGALGLFTKNDAVKLFDQSGTSYDITGKYIAHGVYTRNNTDENIVISEARTINLQRTSLGSNGRTNFAYLGIFDEATGRVVPILNASGLSVAITKNGEPTNEVSFSIGPGGVIQLTYNGPLAYTPTFNGSICAYSVLK